MMGHKICFYGKIWLIIPKLSLLPLFICSTVGRAILNTKGSIGDYTVELQWLKHLWSHEKMFETGVVGANEVNHIIRSGGIIGIYFRFSLV